MKKKAESEGFEPPEQLPVHRISSAAQSTTLAAFPVVDGTKVNKNFYRYTSTGYFFLR